MPVLTAEVLECLAPAAGESYLDLTAGYGGHASAVLAKTQNPERATLVDRDAQAIAALKALPELNGARIIQRDFLAASQELAGTGAQFDMILADLGVSSLHLNEASRGFSLTRDGPLDMRMDQRQELTASKLVNKASQAELSRLIKTLGEEPKAEVIARLIVRHRPVNSTEGLARLVKQAWSGHSRVHPATRTFQALRMAVNDELGQLERSLPLWIELLAPGGRLAVISFHSLEDRLVKRALVAESGQRFDARLRLFTKKPIRAGQKEIALNPRARSAKLRAAAKIKITPKIGG